MKKIVLSLLLLTIIHCHSFSELFNVNYISPKSKSIKCYDKDDGRFLWQYVTWAQTYEAGGNVLLKVTENCKGLWGRRQERIWKSESYYFYKGSRIIPDHSTITFYDLYGKMSDKLEKKYSRKDNKVYCLKNNEKKEYDFDEDLIDKEVLGTCLMNYPYGREKDFEFHMMTNEPSHYKMTMVNKGIDNITVNGKVYECYKLQMIPDLGFLGIFAPFVPKTYFWYRKEFPHDFVRYEGLESGLNTPYIVMEAQD